MYATCHVYSVPHINLIWWHVSSYCINLNLVPYLLIWFDLSVNFFKKILISGVSNLDQI